ncbi:hypothetical protein M0802_014968 [Mischocyttarus mexicanus]|nr:hypothetical protein M0802_014968 [Mischocyttarus mexicanus]
MGVENLEDEAIVISGVSGKFPNSNNVDELIENLLNSVDCISENHTRWSKEYRKVPRRIGTIPEITKFENISFGISTKLAKMMKPLSRLLTTSVIEAIFDAGLNPFEMREMNIGVFASLSYQESDRNIIYEKYEPYGLGLLGSAPTMLVNRMSLLMDVLGSSYVIESDCVGGAAALRKAFEYIKSGYCVAAIVDAGTLALLLNIPYQFQQLEISVINMEYGEHILDNNMMFNTAEFQAQIMRKTLNDCNRKPSDVTYIEADGTAVKKLDREELKAIDLVYGQDRSTSNPLLIGSVKSNIGHSSCTNTIYSIIKVIIYQ